MEMERQATPRMPAGSPLSDEQREAIAFAGDALAPLFLKDPLLEGAAFLVALFSQMDASSATVEWPFGERREVERAFEDLCEGARAADEDAEGLAGEYRRLFVGPAKKVAPPWGSVYTDHHEVLFGAATLELRAWMRAHGLVKLVDPGMPEDHIGYLLACMSWCARNDPEALPELLEQHVLTWAPHFLDLMKRESRHPFYRGLAELTRTTLCALETELGLHVVKPRFYR